MNKINIFSEFVDHSTEIKEAKTTNDTKDIARRLYLLTAKAGMFPELFEHNQQTTSNILDRLTKMLENRLAPVCPQVEICEKAMNNNDLN